MKFHDYLCPLVVLNIVGLDSVQIRLAVISAHCIKPVSQQADTHCVSGNTEGRHSGPCVCLWIISAKLTFGQKAATPNLHGETAFNLTRNSLQLNRKRNQRRINVHFLKSKREVIYQKIVQT